MLLQHLHQRCGYTQQSSKEIRCYTTGPKEEVEVMDNVCDEGELKRARREGIAAHIDPYSHNRDLTPQELEKVTTAFFQKTTIFERTNRTRARENQMLIDTETAVAASERLNDPEL